MKPRTREPDVGKSEDNDSERRLLDCALTLFSTKGYVATGVRELIDLAGVTQPVLYYYSSPTWAGGGSSRSAKSWKTGFARANCGAVMPRPLPWRSAA